MKIQTLYAVAGLIWGLVLGPDAGLFAARVMGSVVWLHQFDDGAWAAWVIVPFGALIGLTVLFSCYQLGAAAGRRYDDTSEARLRHSKAVPWALLVLGVAVGVITVATIEDRQRAVVAYLDLQRAAAERLRALAGDIHRITSHAVEWPGGGEDGRIALSFRGKRNDDYRLQWHVLSQDGTKPLLGGSYTIRLGPEYKSTNIPVSASELANAYILQMKRPGAEVTVDEKFRLELELSPVLAKKDWATLPEDEATRLDDGDSILIRRARTEFQVRFALRGGQVVW